MTDFTTPTTRTTFSQSLQNLP